MVYRYESDEDAFVEYPRSGSDLPEIAPGPPAPAGPSPSRFPTPSLPRAVPPAPPAPPAVEPVPVPVRASVQLPLEPTTPGHAPTEPPDLPRSRRPDSGRDGGRFWQVIVGGAAVLVLLALGGIGATALLGDRTADPDSEPTAPIAQQPGAAPTTEPPGQALDSRDTDRQPLTAKEVFPGRKLVVADGEPAYDVLRTQSSRNCAVAATGEIADLLDRLGCTQVVRGTLRSPDDEHLVTAGLFNLTDLANAQRARDRIRELLDDREGRFRGMPAGEDTESVATAAARVGWQVRGHYLAYSVVTRADGGAVPAGDNAVREVIYDMIELHLNKGVLDRRAAAGVAVQPGAETSEPTATPRGTDPTSGGELPGN
ncbi:hypothetical protein [Micromonospora sp. CPCC 205556]|uniref:hypothetical protein n=1 Tax=Micromonospora sp. CPCC 205556 TaxID=3122398 RepID=UPI002FEF6ADD